MSFLTKLVGNPTTLNSVRSYTVVVNVFGRRTIDTHKEAEQKVQAATIPVSAVSIYRFHCTSLKKLYKLTIGIKGNGWRSFFHPSRSYKRKKSTNFHSSQKLYAVWNISTKKMENRLWKRKKMGKPNYGLGLNVIFSMIFI